MRNIIFKGTDGSIAIMSLVEGADIDDAIRKFRDSHEKGFYIEYFECEPELPLSREFRDAWMYKNNKVVIDEGKAKSIHMSRIRHVRNEKLEQLDKEQLRFLNDVNKLAEIEMKKQELRELPNKWNTLEWPSDIIGER